MPVRDTEAVLEDIRATLDAISSSLSVIAITLIKKNEGNISDEQASDAYYEMLDRFEGA